MTRRPTPRRPGPARFKNRPRPELESLEARTLLSTLPDFQNPSFDSLIHDDTARQQYQVDGSGLAAAVIDTGIDYTGSALGGSFGPGSKVEGGYDLAMNKPDPRAATWSHGTMVAGLIASTDPNASGVAPGADLVALRVFGDNNQGSFDTIANALQWVIDNYAQEKITVVNLSISDGANYPSDWYSNDGGIGQRIAGLVDQLRALRIPVVTAAGNSFNGEQGMGFIAIEPGTISVTASDPSDHLVANAQRLGSAVGGTSFTDVAAPGSNLFTTDNGGAQARVEGTSFATALVTGSIVLLQEIYQERFGTLPQVNDVLSWLRDGSDPIVDSTTGLTFPRLDVEKAASLIPAAPPTVPAPTAPLAPATPPTVIATVPAPTETPPAVTRIADTTRSTPTTTPASAPVSIPPASGAITAVPASTSISLANPGSSRTVELVAQGLRSSEQTRPKPARFPGPSRTKVVKPRARRQTGNGLAAIAMAKFSAVAKPHRWQGRTLVGKRIA
jgi:hypothetical protein